MLRMGIVVLAVSLSSAGVAGAGTYVAIEGRTLYRRPDLKAEKVPTTGTRLLQVIARRGAWFEVELTGAGGHCGLYGMASIGLRLFVQARDTLPVTRRAVRRRLGKGTSIYVRKGAPLSVPWVRRRVPRRLRGRQFQLDKSWVRFSSTQEEETARPSSVTLGDGTRLPLYSGAAVAVKRRTKKRWLVEHRPSPCVRVTGWMPSDAVEKEEGGVLGGVVGGALGELRGDGTTYLLRAGSKITWPDHSPAGVTLRVIAVQQRRRPGGNTHCEKLPVGSNIPDQQLCYRTQDLDPPRRSGSSLPPPPPPPPKAPVIVPSLVLETQRLSGNKHVVPDEATKRAIRKDGKKRLVTAVKMCVGASGRVTKVVLLKSSGYRAYDSKINSEMRAWTFRPYRVNGKAVPACAAVTFIYRQR